MSINLDKGGAINLSKSGSGSSHNNIRFGLGWDANDGSTGYEFDLDASAFVLKTGSDGEPHLVSDQHFVFFNNLQTPDSSVKHTGDNLTGAGDGDDESIMVNLETLNANDAINEVSFVVTIHDAKGRNQNFGQVANAHITAYDSDSNEELATYHLTEEFTTETAVQFGSVVKDENGEWSFEAVGAGYEAELGDFVAQYATEK